MKKLTIYLLLALITFISCQTEQTEVEPIIEENPIFPIPRLQKSEDNKTRRIYTEATYSEGFACNWFNSPYVQPKPTIKGNLLWLDLDYNAGAGDQSNNLYVPWYFYEAFIWTHEQNPYQNTNQNTFRADVLPGGYIAMWFTHKMNRGRVSIIPWVGSWGDKFDIYLYYDGSNDGQANGQWFLANQDLFIEDQVYDYDIDLPQNIPAGSQVAVLLYAHPDNYSPVFFNEVILQ